jgi:hypothetical protein
MICSRHEGGCIAIFEAFEEVVIVWLSIMDVLARKGS